MPVRLDPWDDEQEIVAKVGTGDPVAEQRIEEFHAAGTTILIVSHDPGAARENCQRAIWLEQGRLLEDGPTEEVLSRYREFSEGGGTGV